jgi:hypothetical protein
LGLIAGCGARCERARGRTIKESGPGARGEQPRLGRRHPGMRRVRPDLIVVEPPPLEQAAGVAEVLEDLLVEQLVAQPADEALDESVLLRLARGDVVQGVQVIQTMASSLVAKRDPSNA